MKKLLIGLTLLASMSSFSTTVQTEITLDLTSISEESMSLLASSPQDVFSIVVSRRITNFEDESCFRRYINSHESFARMAVGGKIDSISSSLFIKSNGTYLGMLPRWTGVSGASVPDGIQCKLKTLK